MCSLLRYTWHGRRDFREEKTATLATSHRTCNVSLLSIITDHNRVSHQFKSSTQVSFTIIIYVYMQFKRFYCYSTSPKFLWASWSFWKTPFRQDTPVDPTMVPSPPPSARHHFVVRLRPRQPVASPHAQSSDLHRQRRSCRQIPGILSWVKINPTEIMTSPSWSAVSWKNLKRFWESKEKINSIDLNIWKLHSYWKEESPICGGRLWGRGSHSSG